MAKFVFVAVLLLATVAASMAAPAEEFSDDGGTFEGQAVEEAEEHLRFRRVTCDLLSFGGVVGDSACAANCLSMGKAGGSCNGGVCECRTTTLKELWDRRFG